MTGGGTGVALNDTDRTSTDARGFGALIRQHRLEASLSQEALAERSRLSVATIAAIERGRSKTPRPATVLLLAQALGLSADDRARLIDAAGRYPSAATANVESSGAVSSPVAIRHNLPPSLTRFVGRREDLAYVQRALADARLVTLTGTGGVGKTRLALEGARQIAESDRPRYPAGIWRIELAPVADGGSIARAIAAVLGVRDVPGREPLETLTHWLRQRRLLLLLDNCEHLIADCAAVVSALLEGCPGVSILATSREALNVQGEVVFPVRPLEADSDALALFADLAMRASPRFVLAARHEVACVHPTETDQARRELPMTVPGDHLFPHWRGRRGHREDGGELQAIPRRWALASERHAGLGAVSPIGSAAARPGSSFRSTVRATRKSISSAISTARACSTSASGRRTSERRSSTRSRPAPSSSRSTTDAQGNTAVQLQPAADVKPEQLDALGTRGPGLIWIWASAAGTWSTSARPPGKKWLKDWLAEDYDKIVLTPAPEPPGGRLFTASGRRSPEQPTSTTSSQ